MLSRATSSVVLLAAWWAVLSTTVVSADDATPRALVLGPADVELGRRIEGQTNDLAWILEHGAPVAERSSTALIELGRARDVRVVIAFEESSDAFVLDVVDVLGQRRFTRRFEGGTGSARREEVAVVLRASLVAIGLGGEIGVRVPQVAPPASESLEVVPEAPPRVEAPSPTRRVALDLGVLAWLVFDGLGDRPSLGPGGRVGVTWRSLSIGLAPTFGWQRTVQTPQVDFVVTRSSLALRVGLRALDHERVRLVAATGLGFVSFGRITGRAEASLEPTGQTRTSFLAIPVELALQVFPGRSRRVGLELTAALDVLARRPTFLVVSGDVRSTVARADVLEPRLGLGLVVSTDTNRGAR